MDFSSIPSYLDPSNWHQPPPPPQHQQQQINHHGSSSNNNPSSSNPLLPPPPLPPPLQIPIQPGQPPMGGSIRPGSMAERARIANIPMPETALKCPRCESTNTKFCYFNNYNLSQPRHFCKTCRRYWTRGGALRNVPVGGGCRRNNKRSKSSSSASATSSKSATSSSAPAATSSATSALDIPPPLSALRFMNNTPLLSADFGGGGLGLSGNYGGIPATGELGFQLHGSNILGMEQWRMPAPPPPQFPLLSGFEAAGGSGLFGHFPYQGVELSSLAIGHSRSKGLESTSVKMEESGRRFSLGNVAGEGYNWGGVGGGGSSSGGNANWMDNMSVINNSSSCSTSSAL